MGRFSQLFLLLLLLIVVLTNISHAQKKDRKMRKKEVHKVMKHSKNKYPTYKKSHKSHNEMSKEDQFDVDLVRYTKHRSHGKEGIDHYNSKQYDEYKKMKAQRQRKKLKVKGKKHKKMDMKWMKFQPDTECQPKCVRGEVCITGPLDSRAFCVKKKSVKKSIKLFHRYQKKEMKQWKKFQKEHYKNDYMHKKMNDKEKDLHKLKKYGHHHTMDKELLTKPRVHHGKEEDNECNPAGFVQMRNRMMGWFHVLHGQDHLMKKQEKGSLKHFHKHESVKKELREHEDGSCQCFKSAMWQYHQMDTDKDGRLSSKELRVIEDNSLEPCVQPFLQSCDRNADGDLTDDEWCCCFSSVVAPCFKKLDEIRKSGDKMAYVPRCDKEGYYMREQCQGDPSDANSYGCWCVDYNGNEYRETFTKGRAHCSKIAIRGLDKTLMI